MSKLFDIKPINRLVTIKIISYPNNRILNKIFKQFKKDGIYKIKKEYNNFSSDLPTFEVSIKSDKSYNNVLADFRNEILAAIPDLFPPNYTFDFSGSESSLGFTKSFIVIRYDYDKPYFVMYHKIKEIRRDGTSLKPNSKQINF